MNTYLSGYKHRLWGISAAVLMIAAATALCFFMFHERINKLSGTLSSYTNADYSTIYLLNYDIPIDNKCVFVDANVQIYIDKDKRNRIPASGIMRDEDTEYNLKPASNLCELGHGEIILSRNIADQYDLVAGDTLYAEYPYSTDLQTLSIKSVSNYDYDYLHPNIDNDVGIIFIGYDTTYCENVAGRFICFSDEPLSDELSVYPQVIGEVISKSENYEYVFQQGIQILVLEGVLFAAALFISYVVFFSVSPIILRRLYLKGMHKTEGAVVLLLERLTICVIPCLVFLGIELFFVPCNSGLTEFYYGIPLALCGVFSVTVLLNNFNKKS